MTDEFYVGYQPAAPPRLSRSLRRIVAGLALVALGVAGALIAGQGPFAPSRFEFLNYRAYEGTLFEWPYPMLATDGGFYLLAAQGKHGAAVRSYDGHHVRLKGALIENGPNRMLEIEPGTLRDLGRGGHPAPEQSFGAVTLAGEIVDTKCHFGVMNPGHGKVHRDCAVRCISGGVPPGFLVHDADGAGRVLLLVRANGAKFGAEIHDYVAEPIYIRGELVRANSAWVLKADVGAFQRD